MIHLFSALFHVRLLLFQNTWEMIERWWWAGTVTRHYLPLLFPVISAPAYFNAQKCADITLYLVISLIVFPALQERLLSRIAFVTFTTHYYDIFSRCWYLIAIIFDIFSNANSLAFASAAFILSGWHVQRHFSFFHIFDITDITLYIRPASRHSSLYCANACQPSALMYWAFSLLSSYFSFIPLFRPFKNTFI